MRRLVQRFAPIAMAAAAATLGGCKVLQAPDASNTVVVTGFEVGTCASPATPPKTGWINCTAQLALYVSKNVSSGYVSAYIQYPDSGHYYHGDVPVSINPAGDILIDLVDDNVPVCSANYATQVQVFDGPQTDAHATLLASLPFTIKGVC